jgi:hypothetical protein
VFIIAAAVVLIGVISALFIPRREPAYTTTSSIPTQPGSPD